MEIWKDIKGYEGYYEISDQGSIYSNYYDKELGGKIDKDGYVGVALCINGDHKYKRLHRIVAEHFIPNSSDKPQVNHKNGDKEDNRCDNLEWVTASENAKHSLYELGNIKTLNISGLNRPYRVEKLNSSFEVIKVYGSIRDACRTEKMSSNTIRKYDKLNTIFNGHYWKVIR